MNTIEKRRSFIINVIYFTLILGLFYLFFKYAFGICSPIIIAMFVAALLQRPVDWLTKKFHGGKGIISTLMVVFCFLIIGSLLVLIIMQIGSELKSFFSYLTMKVDNAPLFIEQVREWIDTRLTMLPSNFRSTISDYASDLLGNILGTSSSVTASSTSVETASSSSVDLSWLASPLGAVWGTAKQIPMVAVGIIVSIVCCCFMTSDYSTLRSLILTQAGEEHSLRIIRTKRILFSTVGKMCKAYAIIILVTFMEMMAGLGFLKLIGVYKGGYIVAIAMVTAIVDILPVLGTGTILVPWGVWSLLTGNFGFGIGILVVYGIITVVRQIIEPKLVATQLGLPPFVTIAAMYIGTQLFGFIGLFLLPISIMLIKVLSDEGVINVFKKKSVDVNEIDAEVDAELAKEEIEKPSAAKKTPGEKADRKKPFGKGSKK